MWTVLQLSAYAVVSPTDMLCRGECAAQLEDDGPSFTLIPPPAAKLAPKAFSAIPLGSITTGGWMKEQLILQANALEGAMPISTFPGAITVNGSTWVGGKGSDGCSQWLPYWTNGAVPMLELLRPDAEAMSRLDSDFAVAKVIDAMMEYVLAHTNKSTSGPGAGWIGPFENEPGDSNGHGLWDPLNMLRTLLNYAQAHADQAKAIAKACIAHLTAEAKLLHTDPVIKWASTRWPTFVEICQYSIDVLIPEFGDDLDVTPLGAKATTTLLLNASQLFRVKGMNWTSYYHQTGAVKFPEKSIPNWNTNDHGVNNAEGAMRWPAVAYRMSGGAASDRKEQDFMLGMLDKWQGQVTALFCADEVFCGRAAHRGTETCTVVEAMASLELAFTTFGDAALMDRIERLAFNAMPAALTADMWTHVYVQNANSVFAGRTGPAEAAVDPSRRHHSLHYQHQSTRTKGGCNPNAPCGGSSGGTRHRDHALGDTPSGEDQTANFYGVSHFPCCITNFGQGWPKFAMHAIVADPTHNAVVIASLVPASASITTLPATRSTQGNGAGAVVVKTDSKYPFGDDATITVTVPATNGGATIAAMVRIPGWAVRATVNGKAAANGTYFAVPCASSATTTITVVFHPEIRIEYGWGAYGEKGGTAVNYTSKGAALPTGNGNVDLDLTSGAALAGSKVPGFQDLRSGSAGQNSSVRVLHPIVGEGHYLESIGMSFKYCAGYTPSAGQTKKGSILMLSVIDYMSGAVVAPNVWTSPVLDKYSYDNFKGYSPPIVVDLKNLHIANSKPLSFMLSFVNNQRNVQIQLNPHTGLNVTLGWSSTKSPDPVVPVPALARAATNGAAIVRGPLVFALHPSETMKVVKSYNDSLPARPQAVDYEISTTEDWNYALDLSEGTKEMAFVDTPTTGWSSSMVWSTTDTPFHITAPARLLPSWGYWSGSRITDQPPPSPVKCGTAMGEIECDAKKTVTLVPYGSTNIRIAVFPWIASSSDE